MPSPEEKRAQKRAQQKKAKQQVALVARQSQRKLALGIIGVYASMLILSTHWPRLVLPKFPKIIPFDKVCHFSGYAILMFLLLVLPTGWFRRPEGGFRPQAWFAATSLLVIVAICAAIDEVTQPLVMRDMDPLDWTSDVMGALTALTLVTVYLFIQNLRQRTNQTASYVRDPA